MRLFSYNIILIPLFLTIFQQYSFSQTDSAKIHIQEIIDELFNEPSVEIDHSDLYDKIEDLINNPIDLNEADIIDFQQIPSIDFLTAKAIIDYRNTVGKFRYKEDIFLITSITNEQKKKLYPFVKVKNEKKQNLNKAKDGKFLNKFKIKLRSRILNDLQTRKGFIDGKFPGSKAKIYNRLLASYNNYRIGVLTEKDPGENSFNDLNTFFVQIKNKKNITNIVAGDYTLEFGQGLVLWSPYGFAKGADAIYPVKKKNKNIIPHKSANENNFFRGIAATLRLNSFGLSLFYSGNKFDANLDSVSSDILSTPINGLHRTTTEIRKRKSLRETFNGIRLDYISNKSINAGFLYYKSKFSNSFLPTSIFDLNGTSFSYYSFYYVFIF